MNFIKKANKKNKASLVIVRAGNKSLHSQYLYQDDNISRTWDRLMLAYEDIEEIDLKKAEFIIKGKLSKWTDFSDLIKGGFFEEFRYDYIALLDDDILPVGENALDILFSRAREFNFQICQPSLSHDSFSSWRVTYCCPSFHARFTNFVECMCPVFSLSSLSVIKDDVAEAVSGWGLDLIFSERFDLSNNPMGIIDDVQVRHTKPIDSSNGAFYAHLKKNNIDPNLECIHFSDKFNLKAKTIQTLGGISLNEMWVMPPRN